LLKQINNTFQYKWPIFLLLGVCIFQFFFIEYYWNDKTSTSARIVQSMQNNHIVYAKDLPCYNQSGENGYYKAWGEEPPVFHLTAIVFKILFQNYSLKILPLVCYFLTILGILFFVKPVTDNHTLFLLTAYLAFVPSLYIHAMRFLPDVLAMTLMIWGLSYFLKKKFFLAWVLFLFAVSTKALVIIPLSFLCLINLLIHKENKTIKKFLIFLSFGLTIIPTLIWFYFLKINSIENPFFKSSISIAHHSGGMDWSILFVAKYWSKIFQWYFYRGIGILSLSLFIYNMFKKYKLLALENKVLTYGSLLFILNVILFRGPQISAPWYSFYFQVLFLFSFAISFIQLKKKTQILFVLVNFILSVGFLHAGAYNKIGYEDSPIQLPCHFHDVMKRQ